MKNISDLLQISFYFACPLSLHPLTKNRLDCIYKAPHPADVFPTTSFLHLPLHLPGNQAPHQAPDRMSLPRTIIMYFDSFICRTDKYPQSKRPYMSGDLYKGKEGFTAPGQAKLSLRQDSVGTEAKPYLWDIEPSDTHKRVIDVMKEKSMTAGSLHSRDYPVLQRALKLNDLTQDRFAELYPTVSLFPGQLKGTKSGDPPTIKWLQESFMGDTNAIGGSKHWKFE